MCIREDDTKDIYEKRNRGEENGNIMNIMQDFIFSLFQMLSKGSECILSQFQNALVWIKQKYILFFISSCFAAIFSDICCNTHFIKGIVNICFDYSEFNVYILYTYWFDFGENRHFLPAWVLILEDISFGLFYFLLRSFSKITVMTCMSMSEEKIQIFFERILILLK